MPHHDLILDVTPSDGRQARSTRTPHAKGLMRMPAGRPNSTPLWADGSIALRVRDRRQRAWRMVKIRHPYAIIGRHPEADVVIDRADVADHHAFLFLDARGLFGVDLRTERGTRFAGSAAEAAWLGSGDLIDVGDHTIEVIQLRVNGRVLSGPLADDDPLGLVESTESNMLPDITLRLTADPDASWSIGSSLVFLGRGPACAVRLSDPDAGPTHSALLRSPTGAYLIQFPGSTARLNDRPAPPALRLDDADILAVGGDALLVRTHDHRPPVTAAGYRDLAQRLEMSVGPEILQEAEVTFGRRAAAADGNPVDYPSLIGRLQAETAAIIGVLLRRIEALDEEMAALRDRLDADDRGRAGDSRPPVEKLRWDLIPQAEPGPGGPAESGAWLVDRLRALEAERRSAWSHLVGRVAPPRDPG